MNVSYHLFVSFILLAVSSLAQVLKKGKCPPTPILKDFDWQLYLGRWFEQERYFTLYQEVGECWTGTYLKNRKKGISVKLTFRDFVLGKHQEVFVDVFAKKPYYAPNRLTYTIPGVPFFEDDYEVLATDYYNWTIEYSCRNIPPYGHIKFAWILTRAQLPSYKVISNAKNEMIRLGVDVRYLERSKTRCKSSD